MLAKEQGKLINGTDTLAFFDNWANQTKLISPEWTYMQVSLNAAAPRYTTLKTRRMSNVSMSSPLLVIQWYLIGQRRDALQSRNATLARRYGHEVHHYLAPGSER